MSQKKIEIIDFEKERKNFLKMDEMKRIFENLEDEELKLEEIT